MKTVVIYTDGACSGNPGPGGWGAVLRYGQHEKELSGGEASTTNNRMELLAVISALEQLKEPCAVELYSDSKYVIDALEKGWVRQKARPERGPVGAAAAADPDSRDALSLGPGPCGQSGQRALRPAGRGPVEENQGGIEMYLPIGGDLSVRDRSIVGIFDLDNTSYSKHTRAFLRRAEENGEVASATDDLPKAFVLTQEYGLDRVFLTQFNAATLEKRMK